jgi:hypothetical protein
VLLLTDSQLVAGMAPLQYVVAFVEVVGLSQMSWRSASAQGKRDSIRYRQTQKISRFEVMSCADRSNIS